MSDLAGITVDEDQAVEDQCRRRRPGGSRRPRPRLRPRAAEPVRPENLYPNVAEWVAGFLAPLYAHEWNEMNREWKWCSRWWLHTEAVVRLEAIWKAWELLRLDPGTGASTWLLQHADPAMAVLTSPTGTFRRCRPDQHKAYDPLLVEDPPAGMF